MDKLKTIFLKNFELLFVAVILGGLVIFNYHVEQKMAFLNFYFLPVILGGFYLGANFAVKGAFLIILTVSYFVIYFPNEFVSEGTVFEVYLHFGVWSSFLLLTSAVVGKQQETLAKRLAHNRQLLQHMHHQGQQLTKAHQNLKDYSENLEGKVRERTAALESSNAAIEQLKQKVESTLYATMDASVAKLLIEGRLRNEKRRVSVMFTDLVGFTTYSEEVSPEQVILDLNRYLDEMEPIILAYRGHIDKFLGDGIMCEFGAPIDFENHRLLAVTAALKLQEKMRAHASWKMRIGIATGETIMGLVGSKRKAYTTIGDVVNVASRMEKLCHPGSVFIDEETKNGIERFIKVRRVKGMSLASGTDADYEKKLEDLHLSLADDADEPGNAPIYKTIADLYIGHGEILDAADYYEKALRLDPTNMEYKVAFAESTIRRDEESKLRIRGRKKRIMAFEAIGIKDAIDDHRAFPQTFVQRFREVRNLITIPEDVVLPVEALDGTFGHATRVAVLSYALATQFPEISETERHEILQAAFLADLGKEIIPHHLLNRPGNLNEEEYQSIKKHSAETVSLMRKNGYTSEAMQTIVMHSHERFNGSGYPKGLAGHDIPIGSRILCVADAFDALTSWRPYHEAWDCNAALEEIQRGVEKGYFDPEVVKALCAILGQEALVLSA